MPTADTFWTELFPADAGGACQKRRLRLVRKNRRPMLLAPERAAAAAACLDLYSAQRPAARALRKLLQICFRLGWYPGCAAVDLSVCVETRLVQFLARSAPRADGAAPEFGILAGNPSTEGRRFLLMLFDGASQPHAIVKVGVSPAAQQLILREAEFLRICAGSKSGVPRLRGLLQAPEASALCLDYFPGQTPAPGVNPGIGPLLRSWINQGTQMPLNRLEPFRLLTARPNQGSAARRLEPGFAAREVVPVLFHGDFAPWNIRVDAQREWHVIDWERGQLAGPPAWDWFHYIVQTGILVERLSPAKVLDQLRGSWASTEFRTYASACRIEGLENQLLNAYLQYVLQILRPSEGLEGVRALWEATAGK